MKVISGAGDWNRSEDLLNQIVQATTTDRFLVAFRSTAGATEIAEEPAALPPVGANSEESESPD